MDSFTIFWSVPDMGYEDTFNNDSRVRALFKMLYITKDYKVRERIYFRCNKTKKLLSIY